MKILFVKPPFNRYSFVKHFSVCEPLEFESLAAHLDGIAEVEIVDLRLDSRSLPSIIESSRPNIVGFTALTMDVNTVLRLCETVKATSNEIVTCVGGEHATFLPEDFASPKVDFVFIGDSTLSFRNLVIKLSDSKSTKPDMPRLQIQSQSKGDNPPRLLPRRELVSRYFSRYTFGCANPVQLVQTTVGCPFRCTYCSIPARQPTYERLSIDAVLLDMSTTRAIDLLSIDANALDDVKFARELYREISSAGLGKRLMISCRTDTIVRNPWLLPILKSAGVSVIAFGIESFDDQWLGRFNKKNSSNHNIEAVRLVHEAGMLVRGNFIVDTNFSIDDFRRLADIVIELEVEFPTFQILTPLPGTELYKAEVHKIAGVDLDLFDLSHAVTETALPLELFHTEFKKLFQVAYGVPRLWWLARRLPSYAMAIRGILIAARSHLEFSYRTSLEASADRIVH